MVQPWMMVTINFTWVCLDKLQKRQARNKTQSRIVLLIQCYSISKSMSLSIDHRTYRQMNFRLVNHSLHFEQPYFLRHLPRTTTNVSSQNQQSRTPPLIFNITWAMAPWNSFHIRTPISKAYCSRVPYEQVHWLLTPASTNGSDSAPQRKYAPELKWRL